MLTGGFLAVMMASSVYFGLNERASASSTHEDGVYVRKIIVTTNRIGSKTLLLSVSAKHLYNSNAVETTIRYFEKEASQVQREGWFTSPDSLRISSDNHGAWMMMSFSK